MRAALLPRKFVSALLSASLLAAPLAVPSPAEAKDVAAVITQIVGALYVKRSSDAVFRKAKKGEFVYEGTVLKTGKGDKAALSFVNGVEVKINENTTYMVRPTRPSKKGQGNDTALKTGRVWFKVLKKGTKFDIKTPVAAVSVRGTEGDLHMMGGGNFRASCYEGTFNISGVNNNEFGGEGDFSAAGTTDPDEVSDGGSPVNEGQVGVVTGGKPPVVQNLDRRDSWQDQVNVFQKGSLKLAASRAGYDLLETGLSEPVEIKFSMDADDAPAGTVYVDDPEATISLTGRNGDYKAGPAQVKPKDGDKVHVKTKRSGTFNVSGSFDGFEVEPARFSVASPKKAKEEGPRERILEVDVETERGEKKKLKLKFKR
jgi:ferric-dicitrate binding protein FerR (iron transport regulator)